MPPRTLPSAPALAGICSLLCLMLTVAAFALGLTAYNLTGAVTVFDAADPAHFDAMRGVWGLLLASQIVRTVLALTLLATAWTSYFALPARSRSLIGLAAGSFAGILGAVASRQGIAAAGELSGGIGPSNGALVAAIAAAALVCAAIWIALTAFAAWRDAGLPRPMRDVALAVAALALAAALYPPVAAAFALLSLVWWIGLARLFLGTQPHQAR